MKFQEWLALISVTTTLLMLMVGGFVKLKTDIASIWAMIEAQKESQEKWRLESSDIMNLLKREKADKELLNVFRTELLGQITQIRSDNTREHTEMKETLKTIEGYLIKK